MSCLWPCPLFLQDFLVLRCHAMLSRVFDPQIMKEFWKIESTCCSQTEQSRLSSNPENSFYLAWHRGQPFSFPQAAPAIWQMVLFCDPSVLEAAQQPQSGPRMLWLLTGQWRVWKGFSFHSLDLGNCVIFHLHARAALESQWPTARGPSLIPSLDWSRLYYLCAWLFCCLSQALESKNLSCCSSYLKYLVLLCVCVNF